MNMDLRRTLNAVSDVITSRPPPLREFDQIYMKAADMFLQADHCGRWFAGAEIVFIGDGDGLSMLLVHLGNLGVIQAYPSKVTVLDFDERIVNAINRFAKRFDLRERLVAYLYNVASPLPLKHQQAYDGFYTNPPFGQSNGGRSIEAFLQRGVEACRPTATCCLITADHPRYPWTHDVLMSTQARMAASNFAMVEMLPQFHEYHLDDAPDLTSCSMVYRRFGLGSSPTKSEPLPKAMLENFYGKDSPLRYEYVMDSTRNGRDPSRDHILTTFEHEPEH